MIVNEKFNPKKRIKEQNNNMDLFSLAIDFGVDKIMLKDIHKQILLSKKFIISQPLKGKKAKDYYHFKQHKKELSYFFKINKVLNPLRMFKSLNLDFNTVKSDFSKIKEISDSTIKKYVLKQYPKRNKEKFSEELLLDNNIVYKTINAMNLFINVYENIPSLKNDELKRFNLIYLYVALFETIKELYKSIYIKLTGVKKKGSKINNKVKQYSTREQINFFKKNYPKLSKYWDYDLRNDAAHMLFDRRILYSNDKLEKYNLNLMIEIIVFVYCCVDNYSDLLLNAMEVSKKFKVKNAK